MPVMLCTGVTFVKKVSCLVARIVSFDTAALYLLSFRVLEPYQSKDIKHLILMMFFIVPVKFCLNQCFQDPQLLKCDCNIVITWRLVMLDLEVFLLTRTITI